MKTTILVIDDMGDVRENVAELLELSGHHVIQAQDGFEGIRLAKQHLPELILCDIMMPGLDGYGVAEILSRQEETKHIPLIYLTAKADPTDFKKGLQKGAVDYITKPFESDELIDSVEMRIRQATSKRQATADHVDWDNWVDFLKSDAALSGEEALKSFTVPSGTTLFEQDDQALHLYFIKSGSLRWEYMDASGRQLGFRLSRAGEFAGWAAGFEAGAYPHSAVVQSDATVVELPMKAVKEMLLKTPSMALVWGQQQHESAMVLLGDMMGLLNGSARENVARVLLRFAEWDGREWAVLVSREILAKSIGVAYETIIRTVSQFKAEGWVASRGRKLVLTDRNQLLALLE